MARARAFTLVELLVVIAIISLLMSILMPALSLVKLQARLAACKMNLHNWGLIWDVYCHDNDNRFPNSGNIGWRRGTWILALRREWQTRSDILRCPMAVSRLEGTNHGDSTHSYVMGGGGLGDLREECSYGMNCWLYWARPGETMIQKRPTKWNWQTTEVGGGNNIPVFADAMWRGGGPFDGTRDHPEDIPNRGNPPSEPDEWTGASAEMKHFCIDRHRNGRVNHLFLDWSTRTVGLKELWTLKWHKQFNTAGPWTRAGGATRSTWLTHAPWMANFKEY